MNSTDVEVKERPIIFSGPMVRAILEGRKTQTRRVIKPQPSDAWMREAVTDWSEYYKPTRVGLKKYLWICHPTENKEIVCPYGKPGDRLWVRETFVLEQDVDENEPPFSDGRPLMRNNDMEAEWAWLRPHYRATDPTPELSCEGAPHQCDGREPCCHWKPSIFMPRWASRITLEITNIRVQRIQGISEADAIAEGVRQLRDGSGTYAGREGPGDLVTPWLTAKEAFADGWNSINAKRGYSWESNPWVWVITFKKL